MSASATSAAAQEPPRQLADRIAATATVGEREALRVWTAQLLSLRVGGAADVDKVTRAIAITAAMPGVLPAVRQMLPEARRSTWSSSHRSVAPRLGRATLGRPVRGMIDARPALLGTAVAVPHWIVTGEGGRLACALLAALDARRTIHRAAQEASAAAVA